MDNVLAQAPSGEAFLLGGGEAAARIMARDWASTPLGPPERWPAALKLTLMTMLASPQPMFVAWGAAFIFFYNDAFAPALGDRQSGAMGGSLPALWPDLWPRLAPAMAKAFAGEGSRCDNVPITVDRHGHREETWWSISYTPVRDAGRAVAGVLGITNETTAQVLAERHARAALERQLLLLQQMPGFVGILSGPDHVYEYVNDAYVKIAGSRPLVGRTARAAFPELADQGLFERLDHVFRTGTPFQARALPLLLAGEESHRFIDLLYEPVRDTGGQIIGIFIGGYDVTDRLRAEQALAASEAKFRTFAQAMPNHVWTAPANGLLDWFNDRVYEYSGARMGELDGEGWAAIIHPDDLSDAAARWASALASGRPYETEFRVRRADGAYRWHLARALPIRGADGTLSRWIGTNTDIEDQKAAARALAEINENLELQVAERTAELDRAWRNAQDLTVIIDRQGIFRAVNPAATKILGWAPEMMVGRSVFDFLHPDDCEGTRAAPALGISDLPAFENRYRHRDGVYRWLAWVAAPQDDLIYATGRDITAEKEAAAALAATQEALRQSQKMEAVGQLTGGIAHDFNNMLAVVVGSLDLLRRRLPAGDARALRHIDSASEATRRATLLTQRLLAFSRQQPLRPEPVDPNTLVSGMSDLLRHSLGADIRLETVLAGGVWKIHADPNQLENVILNLAVNGRDAMPDGGRMTIETQNAHLDERYAATHFGVAAGQYVLIAITDTGQGMPAEIIAKAFDPFFTTKEVGKGTGLGLSQVYGFVKQSGGHVKIYSELGHGTTVKVYLPRLIGGAGDTRGETETAMLPLADAGELVLVVEDEPAVRAFSIEALTELGYQVLEADGAAAALALLAQYPGIDLLFTDVVMPDLNGRKLVDLAIRQRPDLKILFTTGYTRNAVVHNGVLDPGIELIGKPFTVEQLGRKIRTVLDS